MIRIVFGGEQLQQFRSRPETDAYVKIHIPPAGAEYGLPFDPTELRSTHPREQWPRTRTYTIRNWDQAQHLLTVDFVVHGDAGVAGPWAAGAAAGDQVMLGGPGGGYEPDLEIPHHMFIGDEAVLPAIAVSLERLTGAQTATVIAQVPDAEHRLPLTTDASLNLIWLEGYAYEPVLEAVRAADFDPAVTQVFLHGEAQMVREVRKHLVLDRGLSQDRLSASGYWKKDLDDETWRQEKRDWNRAADEELAIGS